MNAFTLLRQAGATALFIAMGVSTSVAATIRTEANVPTEITFLAQRPHADPFNEITLDVLFTDPTGQTRKAPAFWAGGDRWKVRYASPLAGTHRMRTACSDVQDSGLHGASGTVEVVPYAGDNPLFKHGPVRVAADRRHFEHADGTPFFWLGDTWWMGLSHRLHWPDEFHRLAADRKAKGFSVVQIVAGLYPDMHPFDPRGANEAGFPWEKQYARIRPEYFDAADRRLTYLAQQGISPCIVGAWGYYLPWMGKEKMQAHWRYLIARYGAWPVIWCAAGEANLPWYLAKNFPSDDRAQVHGWTELLRFIRTTDPYRRPLSVHPTAINRYTSRNATDDESLLDFDLMQTPHGQREAVPVAVRAVRETFSAAPVMPVIDGEASYEMLSDQLPTAWTRAMFWLCLMNGAKGHTYGANGIWQLNRPGQPHGPSPTAGSPPNGYGVITWEEAMRLPGSTQVGHGKRFFESLPWTRLAPMPQSVAWAGGAPGDPLVAPQACGSADKLRVIYVLDPRAIVVSQLKPGAAYRVTHFDPVSGDRTAAAAVTASAQGVWRCEPPAHGHDWVLLLERDEGDAASTAQNSQSNRPSDERVEGGYPMERVAPGVWRIRFGRPENFTPMQFQEQRPKLAEMAALESCERVPVRVSAIEFKTSGRGSALELPLEPGEQLYGLGMNLKVFQLMNEKKTVRVSDDQATVLGDSHAPVPFYVSTRGYGVYVDTSRYASFYFGNLDAARDVPVATREAARENVATSTEELYRPREPGAKFVGVDIPAARGVDVYLFGGPDMRHAVQRYNLLSGGGCLPPMWGLGVWYRASTELGQKEILDFLREFRTRHIPCDVFGLEPGWHSHAYSCSFVWSSRYPDPDRLLHETRQQGYKLNLWEHAFTHPSSPLYKPLLPWSGDYKVWGGLVPDFATPEGRRIFAEYHARVLVEKGVSGFKLDECDHQPLSAKPWSFPEQSAFPSGLDGEQMHLLIGPLYQRVMAAMYRDRNERTLGLVRASGALAAPLPFGLYSDAYDHRDYVRAIATSGFGGVLWCPEVRDMDSLEEFFRRLQTNVFSALTQVDCWYLKNPVWKQINKDLNNSGKFMDQWEQTEAACRRLLQVRMRLLPYLYSAYAAYNTTGLPPARALVMDYPKDSATWSVDDQYMLGPSLMVAPLFTGQKKRTVYLPEGDWYDFWNQRKYAGGRRVEIDKPLDEIPVFVKGDSLLPLAEPLEFITPQTRFELSIGVYGANPGSFVLYEDDGVSFDFVKGRQNRIKLSWDGKQGAASTTGDYRGPSRYKIIQWKRVAHGA